LERVFQLWRDVIMKRRADRCVHRDLCVSHN
jgi:hypothetical protein